MSQNQQMFDILAGKKVTLADNQNSFMGAIMQMQIAV